MLSPPDATWDALLAKGVRKLHQASGLPVAMGGVVTRDRTGFVISELCGTTTRSLLRLSVSAGDGLGGKALALGRCATVVDYSSARGITHRYDRAVAPEQLRAVVAIPLRVDEVPRAMVYAAARHPVSLGDRFLRGIAPVVRGIERDLSVEQEVRRKLGAAQPMAEGRPAVAQQDMHDLHAELVEIAGGISDDEARARLRSVCDRMMTMTGGAVAGRAVRAADQVKLAPRERDVLERVAIGCTNQEAAEALGLLTNTVKAYLKSAMRKLGAANRVQAVHRARQAGLID